jgi:copper chaperone CopZ
MFESFFKARRERREQVLETKQIGIKGMTSDRCVRTLKKALLTKAGVKEVRIDREGGVATVTYDSTQTDIPALHEIILKKGYFPA